MTDVHENEWREEMKKTVQKAGAAVLACLFVSGLMLTGEKTTVSASAKIKSFQSDGFKEDTLPWVEKKQKNSGY